MADRSNLKKKGSSIIELPIPNFSPLRLPFGLPFVRLFYPFSFIGRKDKYMLYLHPCEFLDAPVGRGDNFLIRKLYGRNRGKKAWMIFEKIISKIELEDPKFVTCYEFVKSRFPDLP